MLDNEAVVLVAVANKTPSTIVLSNSRRRVRSFEAKPMPMVRFMSSVLVKNPVVIQRVEYQDANSNVVDWQMS